MPPFRKASSLSQTLVKSKTLKLRALGWTGGTAFGKGTCYPGERVGGGAAGWGGPGLSGPPG